MATAKQINAAARAIRRLEYSGKLSTPGVGTNERFRLMAEAALEAAEKMKKD